MRCVGAFNHTARLWNLRHFIRGVRFQKTESTPDPMAKEAINNMKVLNAMQRANNLRVSSAHLSRSGTTASRQLRVLYHTKWVKGQQGRLSSLVSATWKNEQ